MKTISFTKMTASGNDFIVLEDLPRPFKWGMSFRSPRFVASSSHQVTTFLKKERGKLIRRLCDRHKGIGADGVLVLSKSRKADFRMRIFNPDGTEPKMCGNGARCIALYAWRKGLISKRFNIETMAGIIRGEIIPPDKVKICLGEPKNIRTGIKYGNKKIHSINTGVPHAIIYVPSINEADVTGCGRAVRWHKQFRPEGTNVDFVQILGKDKIAVRTYERGVEDETYACGTGVTASAIISRIIYGMEPVIKIITKSKDILVVDTKNASLTGPAQFVFNGGTL